MVVQLSRAQRRARSPSLPLRSDRIRSISLHHFLPPPSGSSPAIMARIPICLIAVNTGRVRVLMMQRRSRSDADGIVSIVDFASCRPLKVLSEEASWAATFGSLAGKVVTSHSCRWSDISVKLCGYFSVSCPRTKEERERDGWIEATAAPLLPGWSRRCDDSGSPLLSSPSPSPSPPSPGSVTFARF